MAWCYPLDKFKRGTGFGVIDAAHPNGHRGSDYNGAPTGSPLKAVSRGKIVLTVYSKVLGHVVVLKTGIWFWGYCHMLEATPLKPGTIVECGDTIGKLGNSGTASSGPHLHLTRSLTKLGVFSGKVFDADWFLRKMVGK